MWGRGILRLCIQSAKTATAAQQYPALILAAHRQCSTYSNTAQRCGSLAMLHGAVEMGNNLIPDPAGAKVATEEETEQLFPFTWNISQFRGRSIGERGLIVHYVPQAEPHPAQRSPAESYFSITYPFTTNRLLRDQYQRFSSPFLRIGLVLEDLDSFAADVATRHLGGLPPGYTVVTAAIDKLALTTAAPAAGIGASAVAAEQQEQQQQQQQQEDELANMALRRQLSRRASIDVTQYPLSVHSDLRMVGQVCWAGKSSMEVLVELSTAPPAVHAAEAAAEAAAGSGDAAETEVKWTPRAVAHFVMVLAKPQHQQQQKQQQQQEGPAWGVPAVIPSTPQEQKHFDTAAQRAAVHRAKRAQTTVLSGVEPTPHEVHMLYQLAEAQLQRQIQREQQEESAALLGQQQQQQQQQYDAVPISATCQSHVAVMHAQDRNNANSIFGGHLLRLAAELAYSAAVLHSGRHCEAVALGDVSFRRPVPIGCLLSFRAKVVYTSGNLMRVSVVAVKHQQLLERPGSELHASVTNDFSFVFCAVGSNPLRPVEPESLREAVQYMAAHRQHLADGYRAPPALLQPGMEHVLTSTAMA